MSLQEILVLILGSVGLIWYYLCLVSLGLKPLVAGQTPSSFRQFQSLSITTISVSLATFVGSLLGLQQIESKITESTPPQVSIVAIEKFKTELTVSDLQWWCVGLYVLSLLIALIFWYRDGDNTDPAISNIGKSLLGLIGGALSIALNTKM